MQPYVATLRYEKGIQIRVGFTARTSNLQSRGKKDTQKTCVHIKFKVIP